MRVSHVGEPGEERLVYTLKQLLGFGFGTVSHWGAQYGCALHGRWKAFSSADAVRRIRRFSVGCHDDCLVWLEDDAESGDSTGIAVRCIDCSGWLADEGCVVCVCDDDAVVTAVRRGCSFLVSLMQGVVNGIAEEEHGQGGTLGDTLVVGAYISV